MKMTPWILGPETDLTGKIFMDVTVLHHTNRDKRGTHARWLCKCNNCGHEFVCKGQLLRNALKKATTLCSSCRRNGQKN